MRQFKYAVFAISFALTIAVPTAGLAQPDTSGSLTVQPPATTTTTKGRAPAVFIKKSVRPASVLQPHRHSVTHQMHVYGRWLKHQRHERYLKRKRALEAKQQEQAPAATSAALGANAGTVGGPPPASVAQCESGGDPTKVSSDGKYRGKWQFDQATWEAVGGVGDPAAAPEAEQDRRAALLLQRQGIGAWPVCGA